MGGARCINSLGQCRHWCILTSAELLRPKQKGGVGFKAFMTLQWEFEG